MAKSDFPTRTMVLALSALAVLAGSPPAARAQATVADIPPPPVPRSAEGERLTEWIVRSGDNNGMPFVVIDKQVAVVSVFDAAGNPLGTAPALVGSAIGDHSTPGVGDRELSDIPPEDRTTPAGRFVASYGPALGQGPVFWVDYATAISLHAVVTANKKERRLERLATETPDDNRISFGCINVPKAFYESVVRETFKNSRGVVYILPETMPAEEVFLSYGVYQKFAAATPAQGGSRPLGLDLGAQGAGVANNATDHGRVAGRPGGDGGEAHSEVQVDIDPL